MKSKLKLLIPAAALVLLLAAAGLLYSSLSGRVAPPAADAETPAPEDRQPAPEFSVYTADGEELKLSDQLGKPVVLSFWATWCGYCKMHMPLLQEAWEEHGEEVSFLIVNHTTQTETVEAANKYIAETGYSFPAYYDTTGQTATDYGIRSLPTTFFIDARGYLVSYWPGMLTEELMELGLESIT